MSCQHLNFTAKVEVNRIPKSEQEPEKIVAYMADLRVYCQECGQPFEFLSLPVGCSFYQATCSLDGQEAHLPIAIPGQRPPEGMPGYAVRPVEGVPS